jgi:hypothetical protein
VHHRPRSLRPLIVLASSFAVACGSTSSLPTAVQSRAETVAATFAVNIDATGLTQQTLDVLPGSGSFDSKTIQPLQLQPGTYVLQTQLGNANIGPFTIAADGSLSFDDALKPTFSIRDGNTLVVTGVAVTLDAHRLTPQPLYVYPRFEIDSRVRTTLQLAPGVYTIYTQYGSVAAGGFTAHADGSLTIDPARNPTFSIDDTGALVIDGKTFTVDARQLPQQQLNVYGVRPLDGGGFFDSSTPLSLTLLPGTYLLQGQTGQIVWGYFTVTDNGTLDYGPALDGVFAGRLSGTTLSILPLHETTKTAKDYPRLNDVHVFRKGTHNSYFLDVSHSLISQNSKASGAQERIIDQLLYEHVRSFELDLHDENGHPGEFTIYHASDATTDSNCHYLTDCLHIFRRFEYLVPNHEAINLILEFKETPDGGTLNSDFQMQDLDRQLWEVLGPHLYTAREFMEQCPLARSLQECFAQGAQWPTTDALRGKVIVSVIGNWANDYFDWMSYATDNGGPRNRVAFAMRSMLRPSPDDLRNVLDDGCRWSALMDDEQRPPNGEAPLHSFIEIDHDSEGDINWGPITLYKIRKPDIYGLANDDGRCVYPAVTAPVFRDQLRAARANSIFWQVENNAFKPGQGSAPADANLDTFQRMGGIARTSESDGDDQYFVVDTLKEQIIMTDYPWHSIIDDPKNHPGNPVPTLAARAFFQECDVFHDAQHPCVYNEQALTEPGNKLFLRSLGAAFIRIGNNGLHDWETQPSGTVHSHSDDKHADTDLLPFGVPNAKGCLFASDNSHEYSICRWVDSGHDPRQVHIVTTKIENGVETAWDHSVDSQRILPDQLGEFLRMTVNNSDSGCEVQFYTAAVIGPNGNPIWNLMPDGDFVLPGVFLPIQGIKGNDILFAGTRRDGADLQVSDFTTRPATLVDQSFCLDGSCRGDAQLASHLTLSQTYDGTPLLNVNEAWGQVYGGQMRHVYTTDRYEALVSGLDNQNMDKFLIAELPGADRTALYRCMDMGKDYHTFYLSKDPSCPNTAGPSGMSGGAIGYIYTSTSGFDHRKPLFHLRKGTHNAGDSNTHDHVFAVDVSEQAYWMSPDQGYDMVEMIGYVLTPDSAGLPPCVPTASCTPGVCNYIADGCGHMIRCTDCPCDCTNAKCGACNGTCYGTCPPEDLCTPISDTKYDCEPKVR